MAKIQNLTVNTVNIANNAIFGFNENTGSGGGVSDIAITNTIGFPVWLYGFILFSGQNFVTGEYCDFRIVVSRLSDNFVLRDSGAFRMGGIGTYAGFVTVSALDPQGLSSETYRSTVYIQHEAGPNGGTGSGTVTSKTIKAMFAKR